MVKHQSTHWCSKSSTADHYQGDIDIAQEVVRARAISISVILQQKQLVDLRVVKTARAGLPMEFLAIATLALSQHFWNPKREWGEAIATHGVMVTMLTVAQCLSLVQPILQSPTVSLTWVPLSIASYKSIVLAQQFTTMTSAIHHGNYL